MFREGKKAAKLKGLEVCGLILANGSFFELVLMRNKSKRGGGFAFYYKDVRAIQGIARMCDHETVGTFHSHPVGLATPGPSDISNALNDSLLLIFDVVGKCAQLWHVKEGNVNQLPFVLI